MAMDERKQRILQAIVALYAMEGEPVGSGLLCRYLDDLAVSSATLRNEMAALTKLGLLEQPHTSAGRVPSAKGYRYYLDHLLTKENKLPAAEQEQIDNFFRDLDYEPEKLVRSAASGLSRLTGYTVVATMPRADDLCIAHFEVVQVGRYSAAVLAVTNTGGVRTRVARVETGLSREDAADLAVILNRGLTFVSPADLNTSMLAGMASMLGARGEALYPVISAAVALLADAARPRAFMEGQQYLLKWQELSEYMPQILAMFSDDETAGQLIRPPSNLTTVFLGEDMKPAMPGLCVMSKRYLAGGGLRGSIALIGPARMPYKQLMPRLEQFALKLGECMSGKIQEENQ